MTRLDEFLLVEKVSKKEIDDAYSNPNVRIGTELEFKIRFKKRERGKWAFVYDWDEYVDAMGDYEIYMDMRKQWLNHPEENEIPGTPDYLGYYEMGDFEEGDEVPPPPKPDFAEYPEKLNTQEEIFKYIVSELPLSELPFDPYICLEHHGSKKVSVSRWVLEPDMSLGALGIEIISPPLKTNEFLKMIPKVFSFINKHGYTDNNCGLHNSISFTNIQNLEAELDPVKLAIFTDEGLVYKHFKGRENNTFAISVLKTLKKGYLNNNDVKQLIDSKRLRKKFDFGRQMGINFTNLLENNKYIEFRYVGGGGYQKKWDKIRQIVGNYIHNMSLSVDPDYKKNEYIKRLIRLIEKSVK